MSDEFTERELHDALDGFHESLASLPLRRAECLFGVSGGAFRRCVQHDLVDELRADGLHRLARRVEKHPVPVGHALVVAVGVEPRLLLMPVDVEGYEEARSLGLLGGGT